MVELVAAAWGALRLDAAALKRWAPAPALALFLAVSLLGGLGDGLWWAQARLRHAQVALERERLAGTLENWLYYSPLPLDAQHTLARNLAAWLALEGDLEGLPTPLGGGAAVALAALQRVAVAPYRALALWLPYTLAVFGLARALGGRGSLRAMLAAGALSALPHILDPVGIVLAIAPLVEVVTAAWGAAILVKATRVVHGLDAGPALVAALTPALATAAVVLSGVGLALLLR